MRNHTRRDVINRTHLPRPVNDQIVPFSANCSNFFNKFNECNNSDMDEIPNVVHLIREHNSIWMVHIYCEISPAIFMFNFHYLLILATPDQTAIQAHARLACGGYLIRRTQTHTHMHGPCVMRTDQQEVPFTYFSDHILIAPSALQISYTAHRGHQLPEHSQAQHGYVVYRPEKCINILKYRYIDCDFEFYDQNKNDTRALVICIAFCICKWI